MNNIKSLQQRLPEGSLCLIQNPLNLRYFTGSDIDTGTLVISPQKASFITDFRYIEVAKKHFAATDILNPNKHYPMMMSKEYAGRLATKAILKKKRVAIIDWQFAIRTLIWSLIPRCIWERLTFVKN